MSFAPCTAAAAALVVLGLLGGCGEAPQAVDAGKRGPVGQTHQGLDNGHQAAGWTNGDAASWEAQMKARAQAQNEYLRTGAR